MTTTPDLATIDRLDAEVGGRVIRPEDAEYERARVVFSGAIDHRPAAIVRPADAAEVARVVDFARDSGLSLGVRSGGHSAAGHSVPEGGISLQLGEMRAIDIDPEARTAWAQTGLTAREYTEAVAEHGLATGFGDAGSVGIGGITLGGGVGYISRAYGLTIDDVLAAEIVTADGEIREIDADNEPDLFWAIRGGGGNFGVVTRIKYRLHEIGSVVGGMLMLPATPEVVHGFITAAEAAPEELSTILNVMPAPPMPFVPEGLHGQMVAMALVCFAGSAEDGAEAIAPLRALAEPVADMVRPIPFPEIYPPDPPDYRPTAAARTMFLDDFDLETAKMVIERLESSDAAMRVTQLRVLGGAIARVPEEATAYGHRQAKIMANVAAFFTSPEDRVIREAWVEELSTDLRKGNEAAYVNFLGDEGPERVRAAYTEASWRRLGEIKARYDPTNLFRQTQNIPPAAP